nr:hypothetical protein K-LCC10_0500 [Kaumoebavirus]
MKCKHCSKVFYSQKRYTDHIEKRICVPKECLVCRKIFSTDYALRRHEETQIHKNKMGIKPKTQIEVALEKYEELVKNNENTNRQMLDLAMTIKELTEQVKNAVVAKPTSTVNNYISNYFSILNVVVGEDQVNYRGKKLYIGIESKKEFSTLIKELIGALLMESKLDIYWETADRNSVIVNRKRFDFTGIFGDLKQITEVIVDIAIAKSGGGPEELRNNLADFKNSVKFSDNYDAGVKEGASRPYQKDPQTVRDAFKSGIILPEAETLKSLNAEIED